jgi:hypothetical protein
MLVFVTISVAVEVKRFEMLTALQQRGVKLIRELRALAALY